MQGCPCTPVRVVLEGNFTTICINMYIQVIRLHVCRQGFLDLRILHLLPYSYIYIAYIRLHVCLQGFTRTPIRVVCQCSRNHIYDKYIRLHVQPLWHENPNVQFSSSPSADSISLCARYTLGLVYILRYACLGTYSVGIALVFV